MTLQNIRGFNGARDVDLVLTRPDQSHAGWTVIAGRNGSGKTSLLRAIALAVSGPGVARSLVADFDTWIASGHRQAIASVRVAFDSTHDRFASKGFPPSKGEFSAALAWHIPDDTGDIVRRNVQPSITAHGSTRSQNLAARGPWQDNLAGWFCAAYGPFRRLVGGAGDAQRLMSSPGPVARLVCLFHEDASLAEGVAWLIEQHLRSLERRPGAEELKSVALSILSDGLLPDNYHIEGVDSDGLWVRNGANRFPLREMSDGYRTVAALVVDLLKQINDAFGSIPVDERDGIVAVTVPGVVIIDEVDAHLHVSWQKRIGGWLKTHFPNIQFIVTTHSPYICQAADPGGLIRLPGPDQQEPPVVVPQDLYDRIVFGSGDDAVLSDLFGLDTPYSEKAQSLRRELVELEVAVIGDMADAAQERRYEQLRELLTSSPVARLGEITARLDRGGANSE
ncbi:AAA family ATPase [Actinokineospora iranica]|uniref:AAA family ATPase n=1 Tax=Actinokineospora iranica TaxID=1271860 RepID=UPI001E28EE82|nr:ATP-binding protein [Actinokineospora iranica]